MTGLFTGLGLAAAAGLNAWAVLLLFHGLVRLLPQEFPGPLAAFLASPVSLHVTLVLFLAEFIANKIPLVDRIWEFAQTLLRPVVGGLLAAAAIPHTSVLSQISVGIAAGIVTLGTHVAKSTTRLTSTAATKGMTQFALSLAEDIVAVVLAILVFFRPEFTLLFLLGLAVLLATHRHRVRRALQVLFFRLQHPRRHPKATA